MSLRGYPKYRESGVEWLGQVPEHWRTRRLKQVADVFPSNVDKHSKEGEVPVRLCNYTDVYYQDRITDDLDLMAATATEAQIAKFTLRAGDTIITKDSETADDIAVPAFVPNDLPGVVCGYHLSVIRPRGEVAGEYITRLFGSSYMKSSVAVRANGLTRVGLGQAALDNLEIPIPPLDEQAAIAAFLDRETAKIDALVAEQRRLIELLTEKRRAVISHAVTKGLNPDAPMKPSGIDWLGEVPEHWEIRRLKYLCDVQTGSRDTENAVEDGPYPFFVRSPIVERIDTIAFDCEAVFTAGDGAGVGKVFHHYTGPFDFHQRVYMFNNFRGVTGAFLYRYLETNFYKVALEGSAKSTVDSLRRPMLTNLWVPTPSRVEQKAIVEYVNTASVGFERLAAEAAAFVNLLNERRTALISAAVTGKIDVRGLAHSQSPATELEAV